CNAILEVAQPHVEIVRLRPIAPPQGVVQLAADFIELTLARHTWVAKLFRLLTRKALARRALLKQRVHLSWHLLEPLRVTRMRSRPCPQPLGIAPTCPRNHVECERLARDRRPARLLGRLHAPAGMQFSWS